MFLIGVCRQDNTLILSGTQKITKSFEIYSLVTESHFATLIRKAININTEAL